MGTSSERPNVTYCLFHGGRADGTVEDIFLPINDTVDNLRRKFPDLIIADNEYGTNRRSIND